MDKDLSRKRVEFENEKDDSKTLADNTFDLEKEIRKVLYEVYHQPDVQKAAKILKDYLARMQKLNETVEEQNRHDQEHVENLRGRLRIGVCYFELLAARDYEVKLELLNNNISILSDEEDSSVAEITQMLEKLQPDEEETSKSTPGSELEKQHLAEEKE